MSFQLVVVHCNIKLQYWPIINSTGELWNSPQQKIQPIWMSSAENPLCFFAFNLRRQNVRCFFLGRVPRCAPFLPTTEAALGDTRLPTERCSPAPNLQKFHDSSKRFPGNVIPEICFWKANPIFSPPIKNPYWTEKATWWISMELHDLGEKITGLQFIAPSGSSSWATKFASLIARTVHVYTHGFSNIYICNYRERLWDVPPVTMQNEGLYSLGFAKPSGSLFRLVGEHPKIHTGLKLQKTQMTNGKISVVVVDKKR